MLNEETNKKKMEKQQQRMKRIAGVSGTYYVTSDGRVLKRDKFLNKTIELEQQVRTNYVDVILLSEDGGSSTHKSVANLVARAFLPAEDVKKYIVHKDGDFTNNRVDNLEWSWVAPSYRKAHE